MDNIGSKILSRGVVANHHDLQMINELRLEVGCITCPCLYQISQKSYETKYKICDPEEGTLTELLTTALTIESIVVYNYLADKLSWIDYQDMSKDNGDNISDDMSERGIEFVKHKLELNSCMDGWMDGWLDGWMVGCIIR